MCTPTVSTQAWAMQGSPWVEKIHQWDSSNKLKELPCCSPECCQLIWERCSGFFLSAHGCHQVAWLEGCLCYVYHCWWWRAYNSEKGADQLVALEWMWSVQKLLQLDYNQYMGGVDLADQFICYYSVGRKNMKWLRKIVWRLHNHAIVNATVIYWANMSTSVSKQLTNLQYRLNLVHALTQPLLASCLGHGPTPSSNEQRLIGKHLPYLAEVRRLYVLYSTQL